MPIYNSYYGYMKSSTKQLGINLIQIIKSYQKYTKILANSLKKTKSSEKVSKTGENFAEKFNFGHLVPTVNGKIKGALPSTIIHFA